MSSSSIAMDGWQTKRQYSWGCNTFIMFYPIQAFKFITLRETKLPSCTHIFLSQRRNQVEQGSSSPSLKRLLIVMCVDLLDGHNTQPY